MSKAISHQHAGNLSGTPAARVILEHDERHLRRKLITLDTGDSVLVDLPQTVSLNAGDALVLEDGGLIEIVAAQEALLEIRGRSDTHLKKLCWHIGNRHLPAQIEDGRVLIRRDHVIADMLSGLGATLNEVTEPFSPERGAYHSHGHSHSHD